MRPSVFAFPLLTLFAAWGRAAEPAAPPPSNYGWGLPVAASTYAGDIDFGLYLIHGAMFLIFILWGIFFTYLLLKYRQRPGAGAKGGDSHESILGLMPDFAVMTFEIALIAFYAIPTWSSIKMHAPSEAESNVIAVVAEQFAWNAQYPGPDGKFGRRDPKLVHFTNPIGLDRGDPAAADDVVGANEIHMPLGKPTLIHLTSKDVIHSFFVPEFRIKQDALPGMNIPVWVQPTTPGVYELVCAQLCGVSHSLMRGSVVVETPEDFAAFLSSRRQP